MYFHVFIDGFRQSTVHNFHFIGLWLTQLTNPINLFSPITMHMIYPHPIQHILPYGLYLPALKKYMINVLLLITKATCIIIQEPKSN